MKSIRVFALLLAMGVVAALSQQTQPSQQPPQAQAQPSQPQQPTQPQQTQPQPSQPTQPAVPQPSPAQPTQPQQALPQSSEEAAADAAWMAEVKDKQANRLNSSRDVLNAALKQKVGITKSLVDDAKCVIIIPSVKRAGFIFGIDYGRGAMSCRLGDNFKGPWSAPSMVALEGGNFGLQIGYQVTDLVLLVMNERGVNSLLGSKSKLGVDASYAVGPFGRSAMGATDLGMKADILAFSRTGGAYLGAVLNGSSLRPDGTGNRALYGRELKVQEIVRSGEVVVPPAGRPLIQTLDQLKVVAAAPSGGSNK